VAISLVEAQGLAELVAAMPAERQAAVRQRFAEAVRRLEDANLLDAGEPRGVRALRARDLGDAPSSLQDLGRRYFALQIACPFLEAESCSIHPDRPLVCREYHVTSPAERCARLYDEPVERVDTVKQVGTAVMRTAHTEAGAPMQKIPLVLSLEWYETLAAQGPGAGARLLAPGADSLEQLRRLIGELGG
jgi:Fe-S-cluster containining protein